MPDGAPKRTRAIADPTTAAQVTATDVDVAIETFRRDAPPTVRDLLDAKPLAPDDTSR